MLFTHQQEHCASGGRSTLFALAGAAAAQWQEDDECIPFACTAPCNGCMAFEGKHSLGVLFA